MFAADGDVDVTSGVTSRGVTPDVCSCDDVEQEGTVGLETGTGRTGMVSCDSEDDPNGSSEKWSAADTGVDLGLRNLDG
jgi:hypothetical protein